MKSSKIVLVGCGSVGSTFAYTLLLKGIANELVIIDVDREKAEGHVLDLNHGLMLAEPMQISVGDYPDCAGADVIVITAGLAQKPGQSRTDLLDRNVAIFKDIIAQVVEHNQDGILLIATNPVDVLTQVALKLSGWPPERVIGSGTLLDSSRLRYLVARKLQIDPRSVHGGIIGEHGDSEVALWSSLQVAGMVPETMPTNSKWHLSDRDKEDIAREARTAADRIIEAKGSTYFAIALALARICEAILKDQHSVLHVSTQLKNYHGISGICLGVPAIVGRQGVVEVIDLPLVDEELHDLALSGEKIRALLTEVGFA